MGFEVVGLVFWVWELHKVCRPVAAGIAEGALRPPMPALCRNCESTEQYLLVLDAVAARRDDAGKDDFKGSAAQESRPLAACRK